MHVTIVAVTYLLYKGFSFFSALEQNELSL